MYVYMYIYIYISLYINIYLYIHLYSSISLSPAYAPLLVQRALVLGACSQEAKERDESEFSGLGHAEVR